MIDAGSGVNSGKSPFEPWSVGLVPSARGRSQCGSARAPGPRRVELVHGEDADAAFAIGGVGAGAVGRISGLPDAVPLREREVQVNLAEPRAQSVGMWWARRVFANDVDLLATLTRAAEGEVYP